MPTGYTNSILHGASFEQFAWNCARAFGANIMMRDDPADAPVTDYEPSDYHAKAIRESEQSLADLRKMTTLDATHAAKGEFEKLTKQFQESADEMKKQRQLYADMLSKVKAWQPPTADHVHMKEFMVKQIEESIQFDCPDDRRSWLDEPKLMTGEQWLADKIKKAEWDIEYHTKHNAEEIERTNQRNEWNRKLRESVPQPSKLVL